MLVFEQSLHLLVLTILKNISQFGKDYPIYCGKIKAMFQTTNQS